MCTVCLEITSKGAGIQSCKCESSEKSRLSRVDLPNGYGLCVICATRLSGGTSRWSWLACDSCLDLNRYVRSRYGVFLPLGRHSIMNNQFVRISSADSAFEEIGTRMLKVAKSQQALLGWRFLRTRSLIEQNEAWISQQFISIEDWERYFLNSRKISTYAYKSFFGVTSWKDLETRYRGKY